MRLTTDVADLGERIERATSRGTNVVFACDDERRVPWEEIHDDARGLAPALEALDVGPGQRVALVGETSRQLVTAIQATWLTGGAVVIPPVSLGGARPSGLPRLRSILDAADPALVVADPDWAALLGDDGIAPVMPLPNLADRAGPSDAFHRPPRPTGSPAVVGFTSGSVTAPKGVVIDDDALAANNTAALSRLGYRADEPWCSWLPLSHDMGMVGSLSISMTAGLDLVLASPTQFARSPVIWLELMSRHRCAMSPAPSFAYGIAAKVLERASGLDLSPWSFAVNGAEPVDVGAFRRFLQAARLVGLDERAASPAYGMAEATVAVTLRDRGEGLGLDSVDRTAIEQDGVAQPATAGAVELPFVGRPIEGMSLRIADTSSGTSLPDRSLGEIQIRGTSMMQGYFRDPEATSAAHTPDGWFRTGDLGYVVDGQLVVWGRLKELIILGGRNIVPTDVENALRSVPGVSPGGAVAFGDATDNSEGLIVVAEIVATESQGQDSPDASDLRQLRAAISVAIRDALDVVPRDVVLVPRGSVPRTTSGKLQRQHCRTQWEDGTLPRLSP